MKKRILAMLLAMAMLFMTGCSILKPEDILGWDILKKLRERENTKATTEATTELVTEPATEATTEPATEATTEPATEATTEPTTEATTEPTTEPATEATTAVPMLLDVTERICIPALTTVGDAVLVDSGMLDDNTGLLVYNDADEDDLNLFLTLCAYCGLFSYGGTQSDGTIQYNLLRPGSDYIGFVMLDTATGEMLFQTPMDMVEMDEEKMQLLVDYYMQDLVLPSGYGPNVHPEFFASIGRTGADSTGYVDNYFGTEQEQCYREVYAGVDYPTLHEYLSDMMLCGFDIWYETVELDDNGALGTCILWLENGSSALMIVYYANSGMANLFYQPGVDRYLLKNADYILYMPQN